MPKPIPAGIEHLDSLALTEDGRLELRAVDPHDGAPGFDAYLVPWYVLDDRGTFFVPGSAKKTAKDRLKVAPHLWQHDPDDPIGRHTAAAEDEQGFRITVEVNEATRRGAELMSNLRFGVPLGVSVGLERLRDRSGDDDDEAKLDRRTAPDYLKGVPINELRAITEFRWWESSSVTFPAIAPAKPDTIRTALTLTPLLAAIRDGALSEADAALVEQIVAAHEARAAAGNGSDPLPDHGTRDDQARRNREIAVALVLAKAGRLRKAA